MEQDADCNIWPVHSVDPIRGTRSRHQQYPVADRYPIHHDSSKLPVSYTVSTWNRMQIVISGLCTRLTQFEELAPGINNTQSRIDIPYIMTAVNYLYLIQLVHGTGCRL